jgi:thymidylate synthase ThyX
MQAEKEVSDTKEAMRLWMLARDDAVRNARIMADVGLHKQVVNRILEPFTHINVVVTSTDWDNFFELRAHKDAQPEIQSLALAMDKQLRLSVPSKLGWEQWHLPYVTQHEKESFREDILKKISTARCARVSYNKHDGERPSVEEDLHLYERLVGERPLHASPAEHQAFCRQGTTPLRLSGNFRGWVQHRKLLEMNIG